MSALNRRQFLQAAGALAALLSPFAAPGCRAPGRPSANILILLYDALRADHLGCSGYSRPTSPNIDQLALEGAQFVNNFSQAAFTSQSLPCFFGASYVPACWPLVSRGSTPGTPKATTYGGTPYKLRSFVEEFRQAGYSTFAISENPYFYVIDPNSRSKDLVNTRGFRTVRKSTRRHPDLMLEEAFQLMESEREPFLGYIHLSLPHSPYEPQNRFDRFTSKTYDGWLREKAVIHGPLRMWATLTPDDIRTAEDLEFVKARYDGNILEADNALRLLRDFLGRKGLGARTILVVIADHGEEFMEHGRRPGDQGGTIGHPGGLYNEDIKTPLILHGPGVPVGTRVTQPVGNIDVGPTLLQLADIGTGFGQGESLVNLMMTGGSSFRSSVFSSTTYPPTQDESPQPAHCIIREVKGNLYKLIVSEDADGQPTGLERFELYNLSQDPQEAMNLASSEPDIAGPLLADLSVWLEQQKHLAKRMHTVRVEKLPPEDAQTEEKLKALGYLR